ncbi:MAG: pseudouridine synthase [Parcubacteria group bacterium CG11_big_fil_rev_8_21_14_0_20_39_14]|nr:MAG: pseudouridine synthase [Parcubacteria group bacterium CG11_big_fil_rev_8_21_14_0_20_39_14]PIS35621.1 MAG: RluA family pseudouridine synthase [Parcubacteria group bacterium CG08_land_8_20_14_0_20_38_56]
MRTIYEDENILVIDKPAGIVVFPEDKMKGETLIARLLEKFPGLKNVGNAPRYGIVHRLDKETSGILLIAKNNNALKFLQKQFQDQGVEKRYLALLTGNLKSERGIIETLIGRSPKDRKKQKVYLPGEPQAQGKREAKTEYKVLTRLGQDFGGQRNYTLIEALPKTGRTHQIRTHFAYIHHPIAGDKKYGSKNQPCPKELKRLFLHATQLKIGLPNGEIKGFRSELPEDLKRVIEQLK